MSIEWPELTNAVVLRACPTGLPNGPRTRALDKVLSSYRDVRHGAVAVWIVDLIMGQLGFETAHPIMDRAELVNDLLMSALENGEQPPTIGIVGGRYVAVFGVDDVYDSQIATWVPSVPSHWFETRVFNVRALVNACLLRIK